MSRNSRKFDGSLKYNEKRNNKAKYRQNKGKVVFLSDSHKASHAALQMTIAISIVITDDVGSVMSCKCNLHQCTRAILAKSLEVLLLQ